MESRLRRLEAVQAMVLEIGKISSNTNDIKQFIAAVHDSLSRIMYAKNFYIALYNTHDSSIQFTYFVDEVDPTPNPDEHFKLESSGSSFTKWVILNRKPLAVTASEDEKLAKIQLKHESGTRAEHWMGYPLLDHQKQPLGAMVIQSYDAQILYSDEDQALFELIANHVSNALQAFQSVDRLERAVQERTALLAHEINERKRAEKIQGALYAIAELSFSAADADELYRNLHAIAQKLMVATNFMVALYHPDTEEISVQYFVDEIDTLPELARFPLGLGMTSYVIRSGKAQLIDQKRLQYLIANGDIKQVLGGSGAQSWIGVPIHIEDKIYGVIIVQSYDAKIMYDDTDLELLNFVASHIAVAIGRVNAEKDLRLAKTNLEHQNSALSDALLALKDAQIELVRKEKLASLGGLVAGVAHEINTPLGICVTATSHLVEELRITRKEISEDKFSPKKLEQFLDVTDQSLRILSSNTKRAAALVRSFKQVAVDQSSDDHRQFALLPYIKEILLSLQPKLKGRNIDIQIDCPIELSVDTYPGAISQILTNFIMNSLHHGFENLPKGIIHIAIEKQENLLQLIYADNGTGMNQEALSKLFDPFYTTKRGQGGSGLGAHIVYNLVTGLLGGSIQASCVDDGGLRYQIRFPLCDSSIPHLAKY